MKVSGTIPDLRLAVTGAPATGKTTLTNALSIVVGLPTAGAEVMSARGSGRGVTASVEPTLRAFERRVDEESRLQRFVSDGSLLHEWAVERAGLDRLPPLRGAARHPICRGKDISDWAFARGYVRALEGIVRRRARVVYDGFIHLPIDPQFGLGSTVVSSDQRAGTDSELIRAIHGLGKPYAVMGGPFEEIVRRIVGFYGLDTRVSPADAVEEARARAAARLTRT